MPFDQDLLEEIKKAQEVFGKIHYGRSVNPVAAAKTYLQKVRLGKIKESTFYFRTFEAINRVFFTPEDENIGSTQFEGNIKPESENDFSLFTVFIWRSLDILSLDSFDKNIKCYTDQPYLEHFLKCLTYFLDEEKDEINKLKNFQEIRLWFGGKVDKFSDEQKKKLLTKMSALASLMIHIANENERNEIDKSLPIFPENIEAFYKDNCELTFFNGQTFANFEDLIEFFKEELKNENLDESAIERCHNYIQVLFPTIFKSKFVPNIHPFAEKNFDALIASESAQKRFAQIFELMLQFYGLEIVRESDNITAIDYAQGKREEDRKWKNKSDHNHLRITRMIQSAIFFGQPQLGYLLYDFIRREVDGDHPSIEISKETRDHWSAAGRLGTFLVDESKSFGINEFKLVEIEEKKVEKMEVETARFKANQVSPEHRPAKRPRKQELSDGVKAELQKRFEFFTLAIIDIYKVNIDGRDLNLEGFIDNFYYFLQNKERAKLDECFEFIFFKFDESDFEKGDDDKIKSLSEDENFRRIFKEIFDSTLSGLCGVTFDRKNNEIKKALNYTHKNLTDNLPLMERMIESAVLFGFEGEAEALYSFLESQEKTDKSSKAGQYFYRQIQLEESEIRHQSEILEKLKKLLHDNFYGEKIIDRKVIAEVEKIERSHYQNDGAEMLSSEEVARALDALLHNDESVVTISKSQYIGGQVSEFIDLVNLIDQGDFSKKRFIVFSRLNGAHFTSVIIDLKEKTIFLVNSLDGKSDENDYKDLENALNKKFQEGKKFNFKQINYFFDRSRQNPQDGLTCGFHSIINIYLALCQLESKDGSDEDKQKSLDKFKNLICYLFEFEKSELDQKNFHETVKYFQEKYDEIFAEPDEIKNKKLKTLEEKVIILSAINSCHFKKAEKKEDDKDEVILNAAIEELIKTVQGKEGAEIKALAEYIKEQTQIINILNSQESVSNSLAIDLKKFATIEASIKRDRHYQSLIKIIQNPANKNDRRVERVVDIFMKELRGEKPLEEEREKPKEKDVETSTFAVVSNKTFGFGATLRDSFEGEDFSSWKPQTQTAVASDVKKVENDGKMRSADIANFYSGIDGCYKFFGDTHSNKTFNNYQEFNNYFRELLKRNPAQIDKSHNFIQAIFPTHIQGSDSDIFPLQDSDIARLIDIKNIEFRKNFQNSLEMMLEFYGLKITVKENDETEINYINDEARKKKQTWKCAGDHNQPRISRIAQSCLLFNLKNVAEALFIFLEKETCLESESKKLGNEDKVILNDTTYSFWFPRSKSELLNLKVQKMETDRTTYTIEDPTAQQLSGLENKAPVFDPSTW